MTGYAQLHKIRILVKTQHKNDSGLKYNIGLISVKPFLPYFDIRKKVCR